MVPLTRKGHKQAKDAGVKLKKIIKNESIKFYISPYIRSRQTYEEILKSFTNNKILCREEPRIREQDTGNYRNKGQYKRNRRYMLKYGRFFYRFPDGESGADVYDRVSTFLETLHRDFKKEDFPQNIIIVTHGMTMRLFLMRWYHWKYEQYESMPNPENCEYYVMKKNRNGKYKIEL